MESEQNHLIEPPPVPLTTWVDRVQALFEVLLLAGLASSLLASLPFAFREAAGNSLLSSVNTMSTYLLLESGITLTLLWLVLRAHKESLPWLGLTWGRWRTDLLLGLALVPVLFGLNVGISLTFQAFFPGLYLEQNPLTDLVKSPRDLAIFIGTAWIAGGIKEELQRAFILRRFQSLLGGAKVGLVVWSLAFGFGHYVQGVQGVTAAALFGMIFGIAYLVRGNLIVPIVAHGFYDTVALLSYWHFFSFR
jgi:membrane protease YdiL (CAAX protease family)